MSVIEGLPDSLLNQLGLLPVELRYEDGSLAKQVVLRSLAEKPGVAPGKYHAVVEPLSGVQISHPVIINDDGKVDMTGLIVSLASSATIALSYLGKGAALFMALRNKAPGAKLAVLASGIGVIAELLRYTGGILVDRAFSTFSAGPNIRVFWGTPLTQEGLIEAPNNTVEWMCKGTNTQIRTTNAAHLTIQLLGYEKATPLNISLPPGVSMLLNKNDDKSLHVASIEYGHPIVDQLVTLRHSARLSAKEAVIAELRPEEIEAVANSSPGAALRLAYALMSSTSRNREVINGILSDAWSDTQSDTHIIRAELLAEAGLYSEAFDSTLRAVQLGLPAFSFGLDFLTRRLSTYAMIARSKTPKDPKKQAISELARRQCAEIDAGLDVLQPFAAVCDYEIGLTTWRSEDPAVIAEPESFEVAERSAHSKHLQFEAPAIGERHA